LDDVINGPFENNGFIAKGDGKGIALFLVNMGDS
jgi:hypothetical protein